MVSAAGAIYEAQRQSPNKSKRLSAPMQTWKVRAFCERGQQAAATASAAAARERELGFQRQELQSCRAAEPPLTGLCAQAGSANGHTTIDHAVRHKAGMEEVAIQLGAECRRRCSQLADVRSSLGVMIVHLPLATPPPHHHHPPPPHRCLRPTQRLFPPRGRQRPIEARRLPDPVPACLQQHHRNRQQPDAFRYKPNISSLRLRP